MKMNRWGDELVGLHVPEGTQVVVVTGTSLWLDKRETSR